MRISRLLLFLAPLLVTGCIAPMARTSSFRQGIELEAGGGPTLYQGTSVPDTIRGWEWYTLCPFVGAEVYCRFGVNPNTRIGFDLTSALTYGKPIDGRTGWATWALSSMAVKCRPWESNDLLLLETDSHGVLSLGWVHGFPRSAEGKWSTMVGVGNTLPLLASAILSGGGTEKPLFSLVPSVGYLTVARNFYIRKNRISPNLGATLLWNWYDQDFSHWSAVLGVIWSPTP